MFNPLKYPILIAFTSLRIQKSASKVQNHPNLYIYIYKLNKHSGNKKKHTYAVDLFARIIIIFQN